ncbi:MAG: serine/threonine protein [Planctomycetota bacterium]|nr:MAG: serine/threonine protein [Planctomycetota bacterium]
MNPPNDSQRKRMKAAFVDAAVGQKASESPTVRVSNEVALREGQVIGKCSIIRELGRGGMGAVYLAKHTTLDVLVAVKVLPPSIAKSAEYAERFLREARMVATLRHPNVLAVMDADRDPATGLFYMVMEYIDGGSIADRLARGPLPEKAAAQVVSGVAKALSTAEKQGVIHRDIKPANILVTKDGRVKLADLGLAKRAGQADITQSSAALGTPYYMSPEQITDSKRVDIRSDIYSLGATFFHMMTGQPPYPGTEVYAVLHAVMTSPVPNPRATKADLTESNAAICMRMLEKDAAKRYQTPSEVLSDLAKSAAGGAVGLELEPMPPVAGNPPTPLAVSGQAGPPTPLTMHEQGRVVIDMSGNVGNRASKDKFAILSGLAMLAIFGVIVVFVLYWNFKKEQLQRQVEMERDRQRHAEEMAKAEAAKNLAERPPDEKAPEVSGVNPAETVPPPPGPTETKPPSPVVPAAAPEFSLHQGAVLALTFEEDPSAPDGEAPVRDSSGGGRHGKIRGGAQFADGKVGRGIRFDGIDESVEIPSLPACSVAMWVKPGIPLQQGWFDASGAGFSLGMFQPRGITGAKEETVAGVFVAFGGSDIVVPFDEIRSGWHHVAVSWNGATEVWVAIDGKFLEGSAVGSPAAPQPIALPRPPAVAAAPAVLGTTLKAWNGTGRAGFNGTMDEVAVWDRALTVTEMELMWAMAARGESYCAEIAKRAPKPAPVEVAVDPKPVAGGKKLSDGCVLALSFEPKAVFQEKPSKENPVQRGYARDLSGKNHHVEFVGSVLLRTGRMGGGDQGIVLDGSGQVSGEVMRGVLLKVPELEERTIACWFKAGVRRPSTIYDGGTLERRDASIGVGLHLADTWDFWGQEKDGVSLGFYQNDVIVPVDRVFEGWHHVAFSWDGDRTVMVAVDGKLAGGSTWAGAPARFEKVAKLARRPAPANNGSGLIGTSRKSGVAAFQGFSGMLDEFAIWDRPLSEEELTSLAGYAANKKSYCEAIEQLAKEK